MNQQVTNIVVDRDVVIRNLSDAMSIAANTTTRTLDEAAESLQAVYQSHIFVHGTFSIHDTYLGQVLEFKGDICGDRVTHTIWC